jgi:hypothetical protein
MVALAYLAGVLMPSAALAFGDGAASAYCFDEIAEQVAALHIQSHDHVQIHDHVHSDGTVHHHLDTTSSAQVPGGSGIGPGGTGGHSPGHSHDANCCGSFGFTAVLPALGAAIAEPAAYRIRQAILTECLVGCSPDRIDRPPIVLLPR